jgi:hypothetical protein
MLMKEEMTCEETTGGKSNNILFLHAGPAVLIASILKFLYAVALIALAPIYSL